MIISKLFKSQQLLLKINLSYHNYYDALEVDQGATQQEIKKKYVYWFQVILRVFLFLAMTLYGLAKIFKGQFPDPSLEQLLQPVGEMSPMGLAWTFMGHSVAMAVVFVGNIF